MNLPINTGALLPLPEHGQLRFVETDNVQLAVLDVHPPSASSTVVLVHGFTGSKEDFFEVAAHLSQQNFRVIAHDHRGQNQSAHSASSDYTLDQLAQDTVAIVDALELNEPHLLGHSFGGLVAAKLAATAGDKIASLTMFCSGPGAITPMQDNLQIITQILSTRTMGEAWTYFLENAADVPIQGDVNPNSMRSKRWANSDKASVLAQAQILRTAQSLTSAVANFAGPIHVVYGENDDAWPIDEQLEMAEALGAKVSMIPSTGHCPNEDNPELTAQVLANFWRGTNV